MTSIFARAMGTDFSRLHPQLQRRFGVSVSGGTACIGQGVMDRVWHGGRFTAPFLRLGMWRNIGVPMVGEQVPFTIENYPYIDRFGRETVTFNRTFELPGARRGRFDATMIYSDRRSMVIDYLGTHQHLAVELSMTADDEGGLVIRTGTQRFYEGPIAFRYPDLATGFAELHERFDDATDRFSIDVRVSNRRFGPLFGYTGTFTCTYPAIGPEGVPASAKPVREELRD